MRAAVMWFPQHCVAVAARFHKTLKIYRKSAPRAHRAGNECGKKGLHPWKRNYDGLSRRWEREMPKTLQENLAQQLSDSVERVHKQVETVEFWASAVTGLAAPVPDYGPEAT